MKFKKHVTPHGEVLLYNGAPNLELLDVVSQEAGDLWHSSLDQGYTNCFQELMYQTAVFWWLLNDFENQNKAVCWRVNPFAFVIRETVWKQLNGLDLQYESTIMSGIDFGYNLVRNQGGTPLYIKDLFQPEVNNIQISRIDRYTFFFKNFKPHHAFYMVLRKGFLKFPLEFKGYLMAKKVAVRYKHKSIQPRALKAIKGEPTVSLVIPTMSRQRYTQALLEDHKKQSYLIKEVIIVDATPEEERNNRYYKNEDFPFDVIVKWQTSKGSCRARNEAINLCKGDYIIFADDDIRIQLNFVENHIRLLQTYNVAACNGLDIMAENVHQNLSDLENRLHKIEKIRWKVGVSAMFSNANSCVRRDVIQELIGNDINFDGGYGEDSDFGFRILEKGYVLLHNPFSPNLHLKPATGGYRWWGLEAKKKGKNRKVQPWELENPVKNIIPVPSPTITYGILKHFKPAQIKEWRIKYFFLFLFKNDLKKLPLRVLQLIVKQIKFSKSLQYGKALIKLGIRYK
ncbi:MAG: glycosyltransferase involved in cell wall biosynthesis [Polaribacter sp.]|jgi:glycosyltransferase involved in cell wall biosynthesis